MRNFGWKLLVCVLAAGCAWKVQDASADRGYVQPQAFVQANGFDHPVVSPAVIPQSAQEPSPLPPPLPAPVAPVDPSPVGPPPTLAGPNTIATGNTFIIKIPLKDIGEKYCWRVQSNPPNGDLQWIDAINGKLAYITVYQPSSGTYLISFASFDKELHLTHVVQVGDLPKPDPSDPVDPSPKSKFGIKEEVAKIVSTLPATAKAEKGAVSASYRAFAQKVVNGEFGDPKTPLNQFLANNLAAQMKAAAKVPADWQSVEGQISTAFSAPYVAGSIKTIGDFGVAATEVPDGIDAAK